MITQQTPQSVWDKTAAPTTTDDSAAGYEKGSFWYDSTNKILYQCVDDTASAAVWVPISMYEQSGTIYIGGTAYTVKQAYLDTAASGNTQIVALVSAKKIRVLTYSISANAATNVGFRSHTAGQNAGMNTHYLAANGGATGAYDRHGHFETTAGEALDVNNSAAVSIGVRVTYIEV